MIFPLIILPFFILTLEFLLQRPVERKIWNWTLMLFIIGLSHALGSRCVGCSPYDDYNNIYETQGELLRDKGLIAFFDLSANQTSEYLFYVIFQVIVFILPQEYWLAGFAFLSIYLLRLTLDKYLEPREILLLIAFSSLGLSTQLIRQYLAWNLLAFLIIRGSGRWGLLGLFGSFFIHHSALMLYGKYLLAKLLKWRILIVGLLFFVSFEALIKWLLTLNYYSIEFLTSEVGLDPSVLSYNKIFVPRVVLLLTACLYLFLRRKYQVISWYAILSIGIFMITYFLPLVPVRVNILLLSNAVGLVMVLLFRELKVHRLSLLYLVVMILLSARIYVFTSGDFKLWSRYNIWI